MAMVSAIHRPEVMRPFIHHFIRGREGGRVAPESPGAGGGASDMAVCSIVHHERAASKQGGGAANWGTGRRLRRWVSRQKAGEHRRDACVTFTFRASRGRRAGGA